MADLSSNYGKCLQSLSSLFYGIHCLWGTQHLFDFYSLCFTDDLPAHSKSKCHLLSPHAFRTAPSTPEAFFPDVTLAWSLFTQPSANRDPRSSWLPWQQQRQKNAKETQWILSRGKWAPGLSRPCLTLRKQELNVGTWLREIEWRRPKLPWKHGQVLGALCPFSSPFPSNSHKLSALVCLAIHLFTYPINIFFEHASYVKWCWTCWRIR